MYALFFSIKANVALASFVLDALSRTGKQETFRRSSANTGHVMSVKTAIESSRHKSPAQIKGTRILEAGPLLCGDALSSGVLRRARLLGLSEARAVNGGNV